MIAGDEQRERRAGPPTASLGDYLYERLTSLIEGGEFAEGSRLPSEGELAERFAVSRPSVREALSRLRESGVIVSRKGAGSYVQRLVGEGSDRGSLGFAPISNLAQVKKCFEFRIGVEGEAAFWAAQNRSAETLGLLHVALGRLEEAIARRVIGMDADYDFHVAVAHASANEFFEIVMKSMRSSIVFAINLSRSLSLARPLDRLRVVQAEHIAIVRAIETGDKEAARSAMRTHVGNACTRVFEGPAGDERRGVATPP